MSTGDLQSAKSVIEGLYKEDGFDSIIIYGNMFGGISFKLCKGANNCRQNVETFDSNRWPNKPIWYANTSGYGPQALKDFQEDVDSFCKQHSSTHRLQEF